MAATIALREALNQGISSGNLVDTKIILYSRRDPSGRVHRPKALYANSHVLNTVPYFEDLFFGNFAEAQSRDFKEAIGEEESAENYGYLSDSDLEDDEDEKASSKRPSESKLHSFDPFPAPREDKVSYERNEEHVGKGKVVKIPDMAFVTFQAFLMYLYTGVIDFAPFGSEENRKSRSAEIVDPSDDNVPRSSPKSIYRLADKYDVPALGALALDHIRSELGKCDIVEESFSRFASRYSEIRNLYVNQLAYTWVGDLMGATRTGVDKKIDSFVEGDLEHATETISALWKIAHKDGNITAPSTNASPTVAQITSPTYWGSVKTAFIKSIRKGIFFDRKYWARHSKAGAALKPVYFSSVIMDGGGHQLNKLVRYLESWSTLNDLEGDANIESDCERDLPEVGKGAQEAKEKEEQTRAVLITGSFPAWKSLFFYCCTDTISFAPLKSQGADSRINYIREKTVATVPPPCSPKSIYVLANLLGIQPLCDSALADIRSKVTSENIVDEVFSWVTAIQEKILEMECELLISDFRNPKTIALVDENISRMSDGSSSHCAGALKLGLKKAFELKQKPGVMLRCSSGGSCVWIYSHVSCSSIGYNTLYCQPCLGRGKGNRYLACVCCGYIRTGNYKSCQRCEGRFI